MVQGIRVAEGFHEKTPDEVTSFSISYTSGLASGEDVSSVINTTIIIDGTAGLVVDSAEVVSPLVNVTVSGGVTGSIYFVTVKILTNLGQTLEGAVKVVVGQAAP